MSERQYGPRVESLNEKPVAPLMQLARPWLQQVGSSFRNLSPRTRLICILCLIGLVGIALISRLGNRHDATRNAESAATRTAFAPTPAQWASLTIAPVEPRVFRSEHVTEGKIAVNDDRSTPIFSPYSGRVTKLLVQPGDAVRRGQPLFVVEAADMVQAQNDFISVLTAMNKARAQLRVAEAVEKRHRELYADKAVAMRELEQAQAGLVAAQNDARSATTALEAGRNRLRLLGKTDDEIGAFEETGRISAETPIYAPIDGTIVQRKVGPGQYVNAGNGDPVFVVGDLSSVWLIAFVRETAASKIQVGQQIEFTVLSQPEQTYRGNVSYVAATLDPTSRRLLVRAVIPNPDGSLKPEMFATVNIFTGEGDAYPAVPREAVIFEGGDARVWVASQNQTLELRKIVPGMSESGMVQVLDGVRSGERVVSKGSLFIDRAAAGS